MTITPNMTDAEKIEALQEYIFTGTEITALQEIADLSSGNPCDPIYSIHAIAVAVLDKVRFSRRSKGMPHHGRRT